MYLTPSLKELKDCVLVEKPTLYHAGVKTENLNGVSWGYSLERVACETE